MKKILLLFDDVSLAYNRANPETLVGLFNDVTGKAAHYEFSLYSDLGFFLSNGKASIKDMKKGWDIADFDLVYHRRWGFAPEEAVVCAIYLSKKDVPFIDSELKRPGAMGKLSQSWRFWEKGLPAPSTIFVPTKHLDKWLSSKNLKSQNIEVPFILKSTEGTRGHDNYLVKDLKEALEITKAQNDKRFLIQKFIPNNGDYRVLVGGSKILLLIERKAASGSHKNNTSQGARAELKSDTVFSDRVKSDIIKAARAFSREIAGVDIVFDKDSGRHYFFEVNRSPQIEASSFPEKKAAILHEYFMEIINGKS